MRKRKKEIAILMARDDYQQILKIDDKSTSNTNQWFADQRLEIFKEDAPEFDPELAEAKICLRELEGKLNAVVSEIIKMLEK
jgi:hypothetical protein